MQPLESFARSVVRHPVAALVTLFVVTIGISAFAIRLEMSTSFESFAPGGGATATLEEVRSDFGTGGAAVQVMIDAGEDGDVITPSGLAATQRVTSAVGDALGDRAADTDRPATSWAQPIRGVLERLAGTGTTGGEGPAPSDGPSGAEPDPEAVDRVASATLSTPAGAQLAGLLSTDLDPDGASARAGLVIVPLAADLDNDTQVSAALDLAMPWRTSNSTGSTRSSQASRSPRTHLRS